MNAPQHEVELHHADSRHEDRIKSSLGLKLLGGFGAVALLLFVSVQWPQQSSDAAHLPQPPAASEPEPSPFQYFPAQYRNSAQSQPSEEHIQAF